MGGWKRITCSGRNPVAVGSTRGKRQKLEQKRSVDVILQSHPTGNRSRWHSSRNAFAALFTENSMLPLALPYGYLESRRSFVGALSHSAFKPKEHIASLFFSVKRRQYFEISGLGSDSVLLRQSARHGKPSLHQLLKNGSLAVLV